MDSKGHGQRRFFVILVVSFALLAWVYVLVRQSVGSESKKHLNAGIEYIRLGEPVKAENEWIAATKTDPKNITLWELLSELYINTEQWERGLVALSRIHELDPNHKLVFSRQAACALRLGNEIDAQKYALEELKSNPKDEASLTILAFLYGMQQNLEQQTVYLTRLLAISPNNIDTLRDLGQVYSDSGKHTEALKQTEALLKLKPDDSQALALRAASRFEVDGSPEAAKKSEDDLIASLKLNPLSGFARYNLGKVYMREAKYKEAIIQLELAGGLFPRKLDVPFELMTCYARTGETDKAAAAKAKFERLRKEATEVSVLQKRCSLKKDDFDAHLKLGRLMLLDGNNRQALYYLQRAVTLNPKSLEANSAFKELSKQINTTLMNMKK